MTERTVSQQLLDISLDLAAQSAAEQDRARSKALLEAALSYWKASRAQNPADDWPSWQSFI
jgi:hypothetical protein